MPPTLSCPTTTTRHRTLAVSNTLQPCPSPHALSWNMSPHPILTRQHMLCLCPPCIQQCRHQFADYSSPSLFTPRWCQDHPGYAAMQTHHLSTLLSPHILLPLTGSLQAQPHAASPMLQRPPLILLKHMHIPDRVLSTQGEAVNLPQHCTVTQTIDTISFHTVLLHIHSHHYINDLSHATPIHPHTASTHWPIPCYFVHTPWSWTNTVIYTDSYSYCHP